MKNVNKVVYISEVQRLLQEGLPFFRELSESQRKRLLDSCILRTYSTGETVHSSWSLSYGLHLVVDGVLQGYILSSRGKEVTLFAVSPNQNGYFCDAVLLCEGDSHIDFRTLCSTELVYIPQDVWEEILEESLVANKYSMDIGRQQRNAIINSLQASMFLSLEKRVALHLYEKVSIQRMRESESSVLHQTHEDIAVVLGTSREAVSRTLKIFCDRKILETHHGKIHILDYNALRDITLENKIV